jgi:hypothetical protein
MMALLPSSGDAYLNLLQLIWFRVDFSGWLLWKDIRPDTTKGRIFLDQRCDCRIFKVFRTCAIQVILELTAGKRRREYQSFCQRKELVSAKIGAQIEGNFSTDCSCTEGVLYTEQSMADGYREQEIMTYKI